MSITRELKHFTGLLSLLIVEDEKELNSELVSILSLFFDSVDFAYNGKDGLELYKKNKYDIVLTDISMPKMDGITMSRKIKTINNMQSILVLSAHSDTKYMIELIDIGISQFILKPFDRNTLMFKLLKVAETIVYKKEFDKFFKQKQIERIEFIKEEENIKVEEKKLENIIEENNSSNAQNGLSHLVENADHFMDELKEDSLLWDTFENDIPELMQLSQEFSEDIDTMDLENELKTETRDSIVQILHGYILIFSTLDQMLKMTEALNLLANFLDELDIDTLTQHQHQQLKILEFINNDITRFLQTVFVYKDNVDIYYLEDSLESSITQLKNDILGIEIEEEELEFF